MNESAPDHAAQSPQPAARGADAPNGRRWRRALTPLAASAVVIAVAVTSVVLIRALAARQPASPSPSVSATLGGSPSASATLGISSSASATLGLSPTPAPGALPVYRVAHTVTIEPDYLDCQTASVCYAWFTRLASSSGSVSERTSDGGATWQKLASPPASDVFNEAVQPSCPTSTSCVAVAARDTLAVTTDSGASWSLHPLPAADSAGWIDQVSCPILQDCVVHVSGGLTLGTFLSTTNGGRSWAVATHIPAGAPGGLQLLRCDTSGQCIGAVSAALGTAYVPGKGPALKIMRSVDNGLTWSDSVINSVPSASGSAPGFHMSCSDALHCLYAGGSGVAVTSDGGITWQRPAMPPSWQNWTITSVSCAAGLNCSVALAPQLASQAAMIETTSDGMTWTAQPLPPSPNDPFQYVTLLSCPSPVGCVGLASTLSQEKQAFLESHGFSTGIVQTSPQMLISSLSG